MTQSIFPPNASSILVASPDAQPKLFDAPKIVGRLLNADDIVPRQKTPRQMTAEEAVYAGDKNCLFHSKISSFLLEHFEKLPKVAGAGRSPYYEKPFFKVPFAVFSILVFLCHFIAENVFYSIFSSLYFAIISCIASSSIHINKK